MADLNSAQSAIVNAQNGAVANAVEKTSAEESSTEQAILPNDSATTKAEKVAKHTLGDDGEHESTEPSAKRVRLKDTKGTGPEGQPPKEDTRLKGQAPIKKEYLIDTSAVNGRPGRAQVDDDAAEAGRHQDDRDGGKKQKKGGQNKNRDFGFSRDTLQLCSSRARSNEFSPQECQFGAKCRFEHDLRKYLREGKREGLTTLGGRCPVFEIKGTCDVGWKCRFVDSHSEEREVDGKKELILIEDLVKKDEVENRSSVDGEVGIVNVASRDDKYKLMKKKFPTPKSDKMSAEMEKQTDVKRQKEGKKKAELETEAQANGIDTNMEDTRAEYTETPLLPSEKRRLYYGPETPVLAPLTTTGNLPFRRLCVSLGAEITWSEMAMGMPLIKGEKGEWALMRAHESEIAPPKFTNAGSVVTDYNNATDLKFGAQIAANKPWVAMKTAEVISALCPHLRAIDLNCGCPIDLVYREGSGSALLDAPSKLEKMLGGMNAVSGPIPITVKIRMGTRDNQPTAEKLINRLVLGGVEAEYPSGVAAITLHGRSRQQRYSRSADWEYISKCAAIIKRLKEDEAEMADTVREIDARNKPNGGKTYFVGNGDCYSHVDYYTHLEEAKVDSVMVARGALIKPWIFEEVASQQYLDKSATERLAYVEQFARHGLETWGSDEQGIGTTRRFLLEWLSFTSRYVPLGILERLPPKLNERPPRFRGRNELETLLSSDNYKDWIKISEMFLGPAHPNFRFEPKHKSNAYEQAEG